MPPTRPGRMSRLFVARLQGLEEALLLLRAQLKDGRFDRGEWCARVANLLPASNLLGFAITPVS